MERMARMPPLCHHADPASRPANLHHLCSLALARLARTMEIPVVKGPRKTGAYRKLGDGYSDMAPTPAMVLIILTALSSGKMLSREIVCNSIAERELSAPVREIVGHPYRM